MFSNSKMSEIDPRGGVSIFQISLNSKKSKICEGGGSGPYLKTSKIFPFFNYDASPKSYRDWSLKGGFCVKSEQAFYNTKILFRD